MDNNIFDLTDLCRAYAAEVVNLVEVKLGSIRIAQVPAVGSWRVYQNTQARCLRAFPTLEEALEWTTKLTQKTRHIG